MMTRHRENVRVTMMTHHPAMTAVTDAAIAATTIRTAGAAAVAPEAAHARESEPAAAVAARTCRRQGTTPHLTETVVAATIVAVTTPTKHTPETLSRGTPAGVSDSSNQKLEGTTYSVTCRRSWMAMRCVRETQ